MIQNLDLVYMNYSLASILSRTRIFIHPSFVIVEVPRVVLEDHLKIFITQVTAGNSIELKCDIKGGEAIIWKRNGASLEQVTTNDIKVSGRAVM